MIIQSSPRSQTDRIPIQSVVAAFVKATDLPTLVMLECRSVLEWIIGVGVAVLQVHRSAGVPLPQSDTSLHKLEAQIAGENGQSMLTSLLVGPPHQQHRHQPRARPQQRREAHHVRQPGRGRVRLSECDRWTCTCVVSATAR